MASPWGEAVERSETDEGNNVVNLGHFPTLQCGPLIRPFGPPSPQGEGMNTINYNLKLYRSRCRAEAKTIAADWPTNCPRGHPHKLHSPLPGARIVFGFYAINVSISY